MEKIKEFISSPKKTAILGLICSILEILINIIPTIILTPIGYKIMNSIVPAALLIYFIIVVMRLYKKKGNIRMANIVLILGYIINVIYSILVCIIVVHIIISPIDIINIIVTIINIVYLYNILFKKAQIKYVTNKVFAISNIIVIILNIISKISLINYINIGIVISIILPSLTLPYFYNYYNLLKGGN